MLASSGICHIKKDIFFVLNKYKKIRLYYKKLIAIVKQGKYPAVTYISKKRFSGIPYLLPLKIKN